jgi:integrase
MFLKAVIFKDKRVIKSEYSIFIRVTENRKSRYVPVGIRTKLDNWDEKEGKFKKGKHLNDLIDQKKDEINTPLEKNKLTFYEYAEKYRERFNNPKQLRTYNRLKSQLKALKKWHPLDPSFEQIDKHFVRNWYAEMRKTKAINTCDTDIRGLKSIVFAAIEDDLIKVNPFFNFKSKTEASHKEKLTAAELELFRAYEAEPNTRQWHAKNVFLLSFNCKGIRFSDICKMTWGNVNNGVLSYEMSKTGKRKTVILNKESIAVLDKYEKASPKDYVFPFLKAKSIMPLYKQIDSANANINRALKDIAKLIETPKKISTHMARHTWAQMAKIAMKKHPDKITLFDIQKGLEHHSISMTERYMEDLDDDPEDDINKLIVGE